MIAYVISVAVLIMNFPLDIIPWMQVTVVNVLADNVEALMNEVYDIAVAHTGNPDEGQKSQEDFLKYDYAVESYELSTSRVKTDKDSADRSPGT